MTEFVTHLSAKQVGEINAEIRYLQGGMSLVILLDLPSILGIANALPEAFPEELVGYGRGNLYLPDRHGDLGVWIYPKDAGKPVQPGHGVIRPGIPQYLDLSGREVELEPNDYLNLSSLSHFDLHVRYGYRRKTDLTLGLPPEVLTSALPVHVESLRNHDFESEFLATLDLSEHLSETTFRPWATLKTDKERPTHQSFKLLVVHDAEEVQRYEVDGQGQVVSLEQKVCQDVTSELKGIISLTERDVPKPSELELELTKILERSHRRASHRERFPAFAERLEQVIGSLTKLIKQVGRRRFGFLKRKSFDPGELDETRKVLKQALAQISR